MENQNKLSVQRFFQLAASGERAAIEDMMHDDICVFEAESLPFGGEHRGKDAFFALVRRVFGNWSEVELETEHYVAEGDRVVALVNFRARSRRTGEPFCMPLAEVWTFRDGKIAEIRPYYFDTKRMIEL